MKWEVQEYITYNSLVRVECGTEFAVQYKHKLNLVVP